jgi:hypothetical protein
MGPDLVLVVGEMAGVPMHRCGVTLGVSTCASPASSSTVQVMTTTSARGSGSSVGVRDPGAQAVARGRREVDGWRGRPQQLSYPSRCWDQLDWIQTTGQQVAGDFLTLWMSEFSR